MARIFISYSRQYELFARELAASLSNLGADVWIDVEDIPAGMKWSSAIQQGLDICDVMLVVITPESMASRNVEDEWQYYLDEKKPIIPILLEPTKVHFQLSRIQYIDFKNQPYDKAFVRLHNELSFKGIVLNPIPLPEIQAPYPPVVETLQPSVTAVETPPEEEFFQEALVKKSSFVETIEVPEEEKPAVEVLASPPVVEQSPPPPIPEIVQPPPRTETPKPPPRQIEAEPAAPQFSVDVSVGGRSVLAPVIAIGGIVAGLLRRPAYAGDMGEAEADASVQVSLQAKLLLLMPALLICLALYIIPAFHTFYLSLTDTQLLRPGSDFVGLENYQRLFNDDLLMAALGYTVKLLLVRGVVVALVLFVVTRWVSLQSRFSRVVVSLLLVCVSPVALAALWKIFWGQLWVTQTSPIYPPPNWLLLISPDGAPNSLALLDALITAAIVLVVGGVTYRAMVRGQGAEQPRRSMTGLLWGVGLLLGAGSAVEAFMLPYIITGGGPGRATLTFFFYSYDNTFRSARLAYGLALSVPVIIGGMLAGWVIWRFLTLYRPRIVYTTSSDAPVQSSRSIGQIVAIILIGLPVLGLSLWGLYVMFTSGGPGVLSDTPWFRSLVNSLPSLAAVWLIQIPVTYLAGLSLGFFRPLGRRGSNRLFLLFLVFLFIPSQALYPEWLLQIRQMGLVNTLVSGVLPSIISAAALIVFKLYFDGIHDRYAAGQPLESGSFFNRFIRPSLPLVGLVGAGLSFVSLQSFTWPLITAFQVDKMPLTGLIVQQLNAASPTSAIGLNLAVMQIFLPGVIFAVIFFLLQKRVVERLTIVGGETPGAGEDYP